MGADTESPPARAELSHHRLTPMVASQAWMFGGRGLLAAVHGGENAKARVCSFGVALQCLLSFSDATGGAHAHQASVDEVMEYLCQPDTDVNMRAEVRKQQTEPAMCPSRSSLTFAPTELGDAAALRQLLQRRGPPGRCEGTCTHRTERDKGRSSAREWVCPGTREVTLTRLHLHVCPHAGAPRPWG